MNEVDKRIKEMMDALNDLGHVVVGICKEENILSLGKRIPSLKETFEILKNVMIKYLK